METFLVLGLCVILYEALDLLQSCFPNAADKDNNDAANDDGAHKETVISRAAQRRKQQRTSSSTLLGTVSETDDDTAVDDCNDYSESEDVPSVDDGRSTDSAEILLISGRRAAPGAASVYAISGASVS